MAKFLIFVFLLTVFLSGQICSGFRNKHLCKYKKKDDVRVLSKRFISCPPNIRLCRYLSRLFPKPKPKPKPCPGDYYVDCCQGWTGKGPRGCQKKTCVVLPQRANRFWCSSKRHAKLAEQNNFYKLTTPPSEPLAYPNQTTNFLEAVTFPLLNQPSIKLLLRSASVPELAELQWMIRYLSISQRNQLLVKTTENLQPFTTYSEYAQLLKAFRDEQSKTIPSFPLPGTNHTFKDISIDKYMKYPSQELPFKDIIANEAWQNDDVFTQQRLAGLNPMSLRKMTSEDFSQDFVNKNYDWNAAMQRASGQETATFSQMIDAGRVFIIDYKLLHGLSNVEDYTEKNTTDRREMQASRSPFCVFVVTNVGDGKELKPVAIQTDLVKGAPVYSPVDGLKWLKAKQYIQRADFIYAQLLEHLLKTHLLMEPICVIMRRSLSVFHPLHQILKWHCRGLHVVNSLGLKALLNEGEYTHKLFAIGHAGAVELLNRAYPDMSWADTEFDENLKKRGVHKREELPYFPYRDDGLLIWKNIGDFAKDYVKLYYLKDKDVTLDSELGKFANQLSADGAGKNGGIGMLKGFPAKIQTRSQLIDVLKRIVFIPVQHHSVNYPVAYYGGFVPNAPTKLYDDPRVPPQEFGLNSLPQVHVAAEQVALSMILGSMRYDVLLDYGKHLEDGRGRAVVNKYYRRLRGRINDQITARNQRRLASGKMSYPYLLPNWMPNSIHT